MELKLSKYILISDFLTDDEGPSGKRILFSTRKSMGISVTNYVVEIVLESRFSELPNHLFNVLMFHEIIIPKDQDETDEILKVKGIIGDDYLEANKRIMIHIDEDSSKILSNIKDIISKLNLTKNIKCLTITLVAKLSDFKINESNLNEVREYFSSLTELANFKLEFKLICGIPTDNNLEKIDLSWIENIQIISLPNNNTIEFVESISHLKAFSEIVELKNKFNVRFIFKQNASDQIEKANEILKSIKHTNLRFSLSKSNQENLEEWSEKELSMLNALDNYGIHGIQFHEASYRILDESFNYDHKNQHEHFEEFILQINDNQSIIINKVVFNSNFSNLFKSKSPICYNCMYLSMCGGILNKNSDHNMDCPDLRSNIMAKARMKYKI